MGMAGKKLIAFTGATRLCYSAGYMHSDVLSPSPYYVERKEVKKQQPFKAVEKASALQVPAAPGITALKSHQCRWHRHLVTVCKMQGFNQLVPGG